MSTAIDLMQAWLDEAARLRADMFKSEVAFYLFLLKGERGACPWQGEFSTFERFLDIHKLCAPQRYVSFRDALDQVDESDIDSLGVDGVIEAGRIQAPSKRKEFVLQVVEGGKAQGCPLSPRRIKDIGDQIQPRKVQPIRRPQEKSYEQLLKENEKLKAEVKRLTAENLKLKEKLKAKK